MKNGKVIKAMPISIIRNTLGTKYGKAHSNTPESNAIPLCCFLPYTMYPRPIAPNNIPNIIAVEVSISPQHIQTTQENQWFDRLTVFLMPKCTGFSSKSPRVL